MSNHSPLLNMLNKSIRISGKKVVRDFGEIEKLQSSLKETKKFVNIAKLNLQKDLYQVLEKLRPNLFIESKNCKKTDCWILDLIDSNINFSRGIDNFFISISLKEKGKINACVLYNPIKDENFYFQKGFGGYKNDYRIRVSETKRLNDFVSSFFFNTKYNESKVLSEIRKAFRDKNFETRESGSVVYDISLIASGKIDCLIFSDPDAQINNQISFILSETGGFFYELEIKHTKIYIASNKYIGKIIKEMIENIYENQKIND